MAEYKGTETFTGTVDLSAATVVPPAPSGSSLSPAADAAIAITSAITEINMTVSAAGTVVISTSSSVANQTIYMRAAAVAGGGSYTLAVTGGTLTFNSTGEAAIVKRNAANSAWVVYSLCASSSTAANIATIV